MSPKETLQILSLLSTAYPTVTLTDEYIKLWEMMMRNVRFDVAINNLTNHIQNSKYPPTIAEVSASSGSVNAERKKQETIERLAMLEGWNSAACLPAGGNRND
ncbi:replicative helicase loader/inhibitor [Paenibacillus alvei]|uniref:Replicative helicase loader/inhibitor n=2 Tax=Paenibacillus alvei TaxID=44250 RepID=A0ABT4H2N6_PAEAL|nr:replicative helicase loader/inhibitor [Paenibacillus alvei]MCY9708639.1 replicative helicase loader/inhibitor [Paenibacillus alvei]MCY9762894.1 replicative helicase loader/inhibitor [Paenibacillus alvei]MCY9769296.1 replicative helicase loader/inhibitor [Paenibacillus alvei]